MKNEQKKNTACRSTVIISRALVVLMSAVVKFQLKLRLNTTTLYKVRSIRIVFPSNKPAIIETVTIRRAYFESDINKNKEWSN